MSSNLEIAEISIESFDVGSVVQGGTRYTNDNSDVTVILSDGRTFWATAFTLKNIQWIMANHSRSGENLGGPYFFMRNWFIVNRLDKDTVTASVRHIWEQDEFFSLFTPI